MEHRLLLLSIVGILAFLPPLFAFVPFIDPYSKYSQLNLPSNDYGPDSVGLDPFGGGPYADLRDGRILKYNGTEFVDYAYTSTNRTKEECDGLTDTINLGEKCGRPVGFSFDPSNGDLYIVDAYSGLYRVPYGGGEAKLLANSADGESFKILDGVDFDPVRRVAYFMDSTLHYSYKEFLEGVPVPTGDSSGRLLEYNPETKQVRVLLKGLPSPIGPAVSNSGKHVYFSSYSTKKIFKYAVDEPNTQPQVLLDQLPGSPIKVRRVRTLLGLTEAFWVPVNVVVQDQPRIINPFAYKFDSNGRILVKKNLTEQYPNAEVDTLQEYDNVLWGGPELYVGSLVSPYVGIYKLL